jgi:hypothetical protein
MPETITAAEYRAMKSDKPAKYRNVKTVVDGITFDSNREAKRYGELKTLFLAGVITNLSVQSTFKIEFEGRHICKYIADFVYTSNGRLMVEDVKSKPTMTPVYRLKKKLMLAFHGIEIQEVM